MVVCYITGFIGTPIHELPHALMCLIFGHKIVEIKLFQVGAEDGTLGYVNHSYNKKNIYQRIGNFFIGITPITVISAFLFLLAWLLMPAMVSQMTGYIQKIAVSERIAPALMNFMHAITAFFSHATSWQWWVFIALGMFLALHMTLSDADIKGALSGLVFVQLLFFITDLTLGLIDIGILNNFTSWLLGAAGHMICFFVLALIIDVFTLLISLVYKVLRRS